MMKELLKRKESLEKLEKSLIERSKEAYKSKEELNNTKYVPQFGEKSLGFDQFIPQSRKISTFLTKPLPSSIYSSYCHTNTFKNTFNSAPNNISSSIAPNFSNNEELLRNINYESAKTVMDERLGPSFQNSIVLPAADGTNEFDNPPAHDMQAIFEDLKQKTCAKLNSIKQILDNLQNSKKKSQKQFSTEKQQPNPTINPDIAITLGRNLRSMMPIMRTTLFEELNFSYKHELSSIFQMNGFSIRASRYLRAANLGYRITIFNKQGGRVGIEKYIQQKSEDMEEKLKQASNSQIGRLQLYKPPMDWRIVAGGSKENAFSLQQQYISSLLQANVKLFLTKKQSKNKRNMKKVKNLNKKPGFLLTNRERKVSRIFCLNNKERKCDLKKKQRILQNKQKRDQKPFAFSFGNEENSTKTQNLPSENKENQENTQKKQEKDEKNVQNNQSSAGSNENNEEDDKKQENQDKKASKSSKKKSKNKKNNLTAKQKKEMGLDIKPMKKTKLEYKQFKPLHELWIQYMENLLSLQQNPIESSKSSVVPPSMYENILKVDLHGCLIKIIASKIPSYIGIEGIIIQETENSLILISEKIHVPTEEEIAEEKAKKEKEEQEMKIMREFDVWGSTSKKRKQEQDEPKKPVDTSIVRCILKEGTVFSFHFGSQVFTLFGDHLKYRSFERAAKKFKQKYQTPFQL